MNPNRVTLLVVGAALLLLASALVFAAGLPQRADFSGVIDAGGVRVAPDVGAQAPSFQTTTADGAALALDDLRGRPVVLNFWATWCGPCRVEMPELETLQQTYGDSRLAVTGMNTGEDLEDVLDWRDNFGLSFPLALDPEGGIATLYALRGQPTTFVIAPDGKIVQIYYGPTTHVTLEAALRPYLETAFAPANIQAHTQERTA